MHYVCIVLVIKLQLTPHEPRLDVSPDYEVQQFVRLFTEGCVLREMDSHLNEVEKSDAIAALDALEFKDQSMDLVFLLLFELFLTHFQLNFVLIGPGFLWLVWP